MLFFKFIDKKLKQIRLKMVHCCYIAKLHSHNQFSLQQCLPQSKDMFKKTNKQKTHEEKIT